MIDPWATMLEALGDPPPTGAGIEARTTRLRQVTGEMLASDSLNIRWVGSVFSEWLCDGGDMVLMLGGKTDKGSKVTPQSLVLRDRRDALLLKLASAIGSDAGALRVLHGKERCPALHEELLGEARRTGCPTSRAALQRARRRVTQSRMT